MSDYINKQVAIILPPIPKGHRDYQTYNLDDAYESGWYDLQKCIKEMPSEDVQPIVHGEWRDTGSGQECSVCGEIQYGYDSGRYYCANCGAKMDKRGGADCADCIKNGGDWECDHIHCHKGVG